MVFVEKRILFFDHAGLSTALYSLKNFLQPFEVCAEFALLDDSGEARLWAGEE